MTEKIKNIIEFVCQKDFESFKKSLFLTISERIEEALSEKHNQVSSSILEQNPDQAKASAELTKANAEKQALFVDPMMAKEFFLFDVEYKGHTITIKSLGTGIGKPVISYIDDQQFEVFADKDVAKKESMQAVDKMIKRGLTNLEYLRKTDEQIKQIEKEAIEKKKEAEKAAKASEKPKK